MEAYRHVPGFARPEEVQRLRQMVDERQDLFTEVYGRGGLGPRYRVIDGDRIREQLPAIYEFGRDRVGPLAAQFAGQPVDFLGSSRRAMRVQAYERKDHGFRWHFDGHPYVALVTLINTNRGETQFLSPRLSRWLRFALYPLYAFPQLFSLFPRRGVEMQPGDLLIMRGGRNLHRGVTLADEGERILLAYTFDEPGRKPNPFRDFIAKRLNY